MVLIVEMKPPQIPARVVDVGLLGVRYVLQRVGQLFLTASTCTFMSARGGRCPGTAPEAGGVESLEQVLLQVLEQGWPDDRHPLDAFGRLVEPCLVISKLDSASQVPLRVDVLAIGPATRRVRIHLDRRVDQASPLLKCPECRFELSPSPRSGPMLGEEFHTRHVARS
jgi:hypothetical protein